MSKKNRRIVLIVVLAAFVSILGGVSLYSYLTPQKTTVYVFKDNYESFDAFCSWTNDSERVFQKQLPDAMLNIHEFTSIILSAILFHNRYHVLETYGNPPIFRSIQK